MTIGKVSVHPIIFSGPMVRAILEDRKTQTRRVIKSQPWEMDRVYFKDFRKDYGGRQCPLGQIGDLLWVRETWGAWPSSSGSVGSIVRDTLRYRADGEYQNEHGAWRWRPSIFMPRWASRLTLEITGVRVQRIQEISEEDIIAEGCPKEYLLGLNWFRPLWDSINAKRGHSWETNPWCWCLTFKALRQEFPHA